MNLPWQLDANCGCGENFVNSGSAGLFDGWSLVGGHEYAEMVTDPAPVTGWIDALDETGSTASGGEIADKCVWAGSPWGLNDPFGDVTLPVGTKTYPFAMQSLWSNAAGRCVMTTNPKLYVPGLPAQKAVLGKAVSLQLTAVTDTGFQKYKATGLPHGVAINASTGRIGGKPSVTAGTFKSRITISDYAKSVTIGVTWFVSSVAWLRQGVRRQVRRLRGRPEQQRQQDRHLVLHGQGAAADHVRGQPRTAGARQVRHGRDQQRVPRAVQGHVEPGVDASVNGEYVLAASGKCLTDPASSKANGTKLGLAACKNTANQHWSLP